MTSKELISVGWGLLALTCIACGPEDALVLGQQSSALETAKVAALQYTSGQYAQVKAACGSAAEPDVCAVQELVSQAQAQGALIAVAPELGLGQTTYENEPDLGELPATDAAWPADSFIKIFSEQARALEIYLVIHLATIARANKYSTQIAFGPDGAVVGKHHKFELFSGEVSTYVPGDDVMVFDSPLGKVGLLICADIYGDLQLQRKLVEELGARVVAFSSYWTVKGATGFQRSYAKNWGVYLLASNTASGSGNGGGIFDPDGQALVLHEQKAPALTLTSIPLPLSAP